MMYQSTKLVAYLLTAIVSACATSGPQPEEAKGLLTQTAGDRVPAGLEPATIYEIDGERVHVRRSHLIGTGSHTVRVWPEQHGPRSSMPSPADQARREGIRVVGLDVEIVEGERVYLAAKRYQYQTFVEDPWGLRHPLGPPRDAIVPVVVMKVSP